jgi:hypothetical protein
MKLWLRHHRFTSLPYLLFLGLLINVAVTACTARDNAATIAPIMTPTEQVCRVTDPVWAKPPADSAVQDEPVYGYYYVNEDRSIWGSAWWTGEEKFNMHAGEEGNKMGWFRSAGADLEITGQRLDAKAPPLESDVPCCYPTRFQATGLIFPTEGCWEVTAKAADKVLSFIIRVEP